MSDAAVHCDVFVVGGGMVGASLGLALAGSGLQVSLVEPVLPGIGAQPSFDERCTALANGSRQMLATLGAWPAIEPGACALQAIHVSDAGRPGAARIEARALGLPAIGYTAPNRVIGAALWQALRAQANVRVIAPARVVDARFSEERATLALQAAGGGSAGDGSGLAAAAVPEQLHARLVVAADGDRSLVRERAGLRTAELDYAQQAIVAQLSAERRATDMAFERFGAAAGPLALLPRPDGHYTVVWCAARGDASGLLALDDAAFCAAVQAAFGWRVGAFTRAGARAAYPLTLRRAQTLTAQRLVLVGNAAQSLHPVAGQGFNLGLRDAAALAERLAQAAADGSDPGAPALLADYAADRRQDREGMLTFTDGLVRLFALDFPGAATLRSAGLLLFDSAPLAKQALSGVSWGFGARTPRLLRGLTLSSERRSG